MLRDSIPDLQHEPSPLHEALLDLPWSDVFTTNYDTLLERASRSVVSQRYDVVLKPDGRGALLADAAPIDNAQEDTGPPRYSVGETASVSGATAGGGRESLLTDPMARSHTWRRGH